MSTPNLDKILMILSKSSAVTQARDKAGLWISQGGSEGHTKENMLFDDIEIGSIVIAGRYGKAVVLGPGTTFSGDPGVRVKVLADNSEEVVIPRAIKNARGLFKPSEIKRIVSMGLHERFK